MSSERDVAVRLSGVSKKYRLFRSPADRLLEVLWPRRARHEEFWALKDIDLEVRKGETLGILGRNGSGKSTLLQVIAGILKPTSGTVTVNGRISALLELGAGFNPEMTGRDNVLMSGAFHGVPASEMKRRLPEIEDFADIGQFFDQPVKTYSSGMFVRLAFAAAVNVEPDILLVDEALAVGDISFQSKCYHRLEELRAAGVTIVVVSHDLKILRQTCDRGVYIEAGRCVTAGGIEDAVTQYECSVYGCLRNLHSTSPPSTLPPRNQQRSKSGPPGLLATVDYCSDDYTTNDNFNKYYTVLTDGRAELLGYRVMCGTKTNPRVISSNKEIDIHCTFNVLGRIGAANFGFSINTIDGLKLYGNSLKHMKQRLETISPGAVIPIVFHVKPRLAPGHYMISIGISDVEHDEVIVFAARNIITIEITDEQSYDGLVWLESLIKTHA